jgi:hypothetical protein
MFVLGWAAASVLSAAVAWAAVGIVRDAVTDRPSELSSGAVAAAGTVSGETTTPSDAPSSGETGPTTGAPSTDPPSIVTTTTDAPSTTSATEPPETKTTTPPPPPPTTQPEDEWTTKSYSMRGGTVSIRYRQGEVRLQGAVPAPGYEADIDHEGPDEVRVTFDGDEHETEFRARWRDGQLDVDIEQDD